jgi:hypothetical protein
MRRVVLFMRMGLDGIWAQGWIPKVEGAEAKEIFSGCGRDSSPLTHSSSAVSVSDWGERVWPPLARDPNSSPFEKEFSPFIDAIQKMVLSK